MGSTNTKMLARTEHGQALLDLFTWLRAFKVKRWSSSASDSDTDRDEVFDLDEADVVSSLRKDNGRHIVALDIDHPAWLVKSSTEGHYHLYIDVPGGIPDAYYNSLLNALANAGVIERGYANASLARGHSDVRLPWVHKQLPVDVKGAH